tara:strand:- start:427 stop:1449 length:1023 start_codon:yes stop_codon:yes gene_type:complete
MALGLPMGLCWDACAVTSPPIVDPLQIPMLLWWDFTDTAGMFQEVDSFATAADANNDKIGRVLNKAYTTQNNLGIAATSRIGVFGRAFDASRRPTFKTGGANGYGYAQFTASAAESILTKQHSAFGTHDLGTNLKSDNISSVQYSYLIVSDADDNDSDGTSEIVWSTKYAVAGSTTAVTMQQERSDGSGGETSGSEDQVTLRTDHGGTTTILPLQDSLLSGADEFMDQNPVIEVRIGTTGVDYGIAKMFFARGLNQQGPTFYNAIEASSGSATSFSLNEGSFDAGVSVGGILHDTDAAKHFDGKVYEFILFNSTLDSDTMNGLAYHYAQKYGIDIEGENE